ncbi:tetratricopeptide repeat protein [Salinicola aestuarinus]|uniref:tetratricopeptide repeat protein n=1 Tax=Salinicola aestuarinus TaxID=1949082 RepID=UPI000DA120D4|nr:tetratricopeptide repeat protein [Salinicola aestuarinus]
MKFLLLLFVIIFSANAQARILYQDPTGDDLNSAIARLSEEDVKDVSFSGSAKGKFLLGLFYVNGASEFGVEKNCQKAVSSLREALAAGITDAGYTLATMYYNGVCEEKNIDESRSLAAQAARDGYILAQRMLGQAYLGEKWDGLYSYDVDKGVFWLGEAGDAGDRESSARLAGMYYDGEKVAKSEVKYFEWLKKATSSKYNNGNGLGFMAMAKCYEHGKGVEVDLVQAYKYYDLSGSAGAEGKRRIAQEMTQDQIDEAVRESQAWQEDHNVQVGGGFIRRVE